MWVYNLNFSIQFIIIHLISNIVPQGFSELHHIVENHDISTIYVSSEYTLPYHHIDITPRDIDLSRHNMKHRKLQKASGELKYVDARKGNACISLFDTHQTVVAECYNTNGILNTSTASYIMSKSADKHDMNWTIFRYDEVMMHNLLKILENAVNIIKLSDNIEEMYDYIKDHHRHKLSKQDMFLNQHSPELWFPYHFAYHPHTSKLVYNQINSKLSPLFHYVCSHVYTFSVYALHEHKFFGNPIYYWEKMLSSIITRPDWQYAYGLDFILPSTHPLTPLNINDRSFDLNIFAHASFLVVDNDMKSRYPKDTIIPYFAGYSYNQHHNNKESSPNVLHQHNRNILLYFAGSPFQSVRSRIIELFHTLSKQQPEINDIVIQEKVDNIDSYYDMLHTSTFCLMIRGDTTSSSRLFTAIYLGCIPIIISDWILLPYESMIDYTSFTIQIEESYVLSQPEAFVSYIRNISSSTIEKLQKGLVQAREVLLYQSLNEFNPVSLAMMDNLINRVYFCINIIGNNQVSLSIYRQHKQSMCNRLEERIQAVLHLDIYQLYGMLVKDKHRGS